MRLLQIIDSANPAGGGPIEGVKQQGLALRNHGCAMEVVCLDDPASPWIDGFPFPLHAVGPAFTAYRYAPGFAEWLTENAPNYDAYIVNGIWQFQSYAARRVLRRLGRKYFVFTHGMLDPWFQGEYPLKHIKKSLYWRWGEYPVLRDAAAVLFTCEMERNLAGQSFRPNQWTPKVVNYGTGGPPGEAESERAAFFERFPETKETRNLLFLGRVTAKKGVDLLLEAVAGIVEEVEWLRLIIAGPVDSSLRDQLVGQAAKLKLENRITWTGMIDGAVKWGAFRASEVFILPSHQENFGVSIAESLACGVPTLISDKVNICREIEAGGAGLVAPDSLEGTKWLLREWFRMEPAQQSEMGERAVSLFQSRFESDLVARGLRETLAEFGGVGQ